MRCPKCHYLSFDPEPRCRNCGYGLGLEEHGDDLVRDEPARAPSALPDLAMPAVSAERGADAHAADDPLADLVLRMRPEQQSSDSDLTLHASDTDVAVTRARPAPSRKAPAAPGGRQPSGASPAALPAAHDLESSESRLPGAPRGPFDIPAAVLPPASHAGASAESRPTVTPPAATAAETSPLAGSSAARTTVPAPITTELPLFVTQRAPASRSDEPLRRVSLDDPLVGTGGANALDMPLIKVPVEPRPPLAVRKPVADSPARARPNLPPRKMGPLDRDLLEDLEQIERLEQTTNRSAARERREWSAEPATPAARLGAAAIDALLIGSVSAIVLAITLRWLDLRMTEIGLLPIAPTAAFLLLVGLGYLLMFTAAGGQTLGKMVTGIRVVTDVEDEGETLSVRQAFYREILALPSVLAFGAGFVPGLIGEQRAWHDRLAHTRVVRA